MISRSKKNRMLVPDTVASPLRSHLPSPVDDCNVSPYVAIVQTIATISEEMVESPVREIF